MLVQPEHDDRAMYIEFLRQNDMIAVCPNDAMSALALAAKADVIVTAILLPGPIDGIELVRRLRADTATRRLPIIVLTACAWKADRDRAEAAGCDVFLAKPCLPDMLLAEIRKLLLLRNTPRPQPARATAHEKSRRHRLH
jgi:CheY-like chemotaxis protein